MISIPFHGSKRTSYKYISSIVKKFKYKSVYEPFGGSGVLSVNLYKDGLVDKAVINDYDHFFDDYEEYLDYKDWIVEECEKRGIKKIKDRSPLKDDDLDFLRSLVKQVPERLWRKLADGNNFCFSTVPAREHVYLKDFKYFQNRLITDVQREYLEWINKVELEHLDYREFLEKYKNDFAYDSVLIIDPPYYSTYQDQYKHSFSEEDTKELVNTLTQYKVDFIFLHDNKNVVTELLEGLNIVDEGFCTKGISSAKHRRKRTDYYALVQF